MCGVMLVWRWNGVVGILDSVCSNQDGDSSRAGSVQRRSPAGPDRFPSTEKKSLSQDGPSWVQDFSRNDAAPNMERIMDVIVVRGYPSNISDNKYGGGHRRRCYCES